MGTTSSSSTQTTAARSSSTELFPDLFSKCQCSHHLHAAIPHHQAWQHATQDTRQKQGSEELYIHTYIFFFSKSFQVSLVGEECRRRFLNVHNRIYLGSSISSRRDRRHNCTDKERLDRQMKSRRKNVDFKHYSSRRTSQVPCEWRKTLQNRALKSAHSTLTSTSRMFNQTETTS